MFSLRWPQRESHASDGGIQETRARQDHGARDLQSVPFRGEIPVKASGAKKMGAVLLPFSHLKARKLPRDGEGQACALFFRLPAQDWMAGGLGLVDAF